MSQPSQRTAMAGGTAPSPALAHNSNASKQQHLDQQMRQRKAQETSAIAVDYVPVPTTSPNGGASSANDGDDKKLKMTSATAFPSPAIYRRTGDWLDDLGDALFRYNTWTVLQIVALTVASLVSRFWNIHKADFVVWDEAHFGKFASYYLRRTFYFDVHPPTGKMLVALGGALSNYNGSFEFESGHKYPPELNYTGMRVFLAIFGALMVPLAFMTMIELGFQRRTAWLAAVMVLCDNAFLSISRYILLDSMLLYYTAQTLYCLTVFINYDRMMPFSIGWWLWLCATGVSIGFVSSVKWIGFFVTALVGLYTVEDLWNKLGDLQMPKMRYLGHFLARVLGLILIPMAVYVASFMVHFTILSRSGSGDSNMSSLFQSQLEGNDFHKSPVEIAYGSVISLKNNGYAGGLLHSHVQTYPAGSKQQQVTCYHYRDNNNHWIVHRARVSDADEVNVDPNSQPLQFLKDGDVIRLMHKETGRNLHSHPVAAPVTKYQREISCYGNDTVGDTNDNWRVEIVDDLRTRPATHIHTLTTRIRLHHANLNCTLRSHNVHLPEWGFKQSEVMCDKSMSKDDNNIWNVEQHWNDRLPEGSKEVYKTSFWKDFVHLNIAMYSSNNALVPDPDKEPDALTSTPMEWPACSVGLRMCGWGDHEHKVFLLGNPVVWWGGLAALIGFVLMLGVYLLRMRRGFYDLSAVGWDRFIFYGKLFGLGWILHFVPFMVMARVTYLHHYFPALYFAILMGAFMLEHMVTRFLPRALQILSYVVAFSVVIGVHAYFAPISYGFEGPASAYENRRWLSTWNIAG